MTTGNRSQRQQGRDQSLLPWRNPARRLWPWACSQYRERKGETRSERCISSEILWKWIDAHGKEYGIGRPYLDKDPPHIAPIDGKEYADKRGLNAKLAEKGNAATSGVAKAAKPLQALQGRAEPKPL